MGIRVYDSIHGVRRVVGGGGGGRREIMQIPSTEGPVNTDGGRGRYCFDVHGRLSCKNIIITINQN